MANDQRLRQIGKLPAEERIMVAREKAKAVADLMIELERVHANNEYLTYRQVLKDDTSSYMAGWAISALRLSSFGYELIRLAALWDDVAENRLCFRELHELTRSAEVRALLRREAVRYYEDERIWTLQGHAEQRFDRHCRVADCLMGATLKSARLQRLLTHRHKWFAHNLNTDQGVAPLLRSEGKMRRTSHTVANALTGLVADSSFDYGNSIRICKQNADQFWRGLSWKAPVTMVGPASLP